MSRGDHSLSSDPFNDPFGDPLSARQEHDLSDLVEGTDPFAELRESVRTKPEDAINWDEEAGVDGEPQALSRSSLNQRESKGDEHKVYQGESPGAQQDPELLLEMFRDLDSGGHNESEYDDDDGSDDENNNAEVDEANKSIRMLHSKGKEKVNDEDGDDGEDCMISVSLCQDEPRINIAITGTQIAWLDTKMDHPVTLFRVEASMSFGGIAIKKRSCLHRYSAFYKMNNELRKEHSRYRKHLVGNLPSLPPKRFLVDHTSEDFILQRKFLLAQYLRKLAHIPNIQKCCALLVFLKLDC